MALDLEHVFRLRLIVARVGEQDGAGWWNTRGQLGRVGALAVGRGLPNSHAFARARSVFVAAEERCRAVYPVDRIISLWRLPSKPEDEFDASWSEWLLRRGDWAAFFEGLEGWRGADLLAALSRFGCWPERLAKRLAALQPDPDTLSISVPTQYLDDDAVTLLAAAYSLNASGEFRVPVLRLAT